MDRSKKKGGGKGGGKQKASTSKGNGTRVEVHKHFDPILASRSFGENEFPEIVLAEKTSTRSTNSAPTKVRKKLLPMPTDYYELQLFPNKRPVSCERKDYRFLSSTSSASSYSPIRKKLSDEDRGKKRRSPTRDREIPPKHKRVPQLNLSNPRIKESKTKTRHQPLQPPRPPVQDFDNAVIVYRDPLVEKIKAEIGMSAKFCNDEVKQTVAELKEEIAKYRRTLNRNVNFLQTKVKCGLGTEKMKENAVQTDPSGQLKDMNEFSALVTRIAELISIEDTKSDDKAPPPEQPQQTFASIATETPPPLREDKCCQRNLRRRRRVEQSTETVPFTKENAALDYLIVVNHNSDKDNLRVDSTDNSGENKLRGISRDNLNDNLRDNSRVTLRENSRNVSVDNLRVTSRDNSRIILTDDSRNTPGENLRIISRDNTKDNPKEITQYNSKDNLQDNLKLHPEDNSKGKSKNNLKDNQQNNLKDSPKGASKSNFKDTPNMTSKHNLKASLNNHQKDNLKGDLNDNLKNNSKDNLKHNSQYNQRGDFEGNLKNNLKYDTKNNSKYNQKDTSKYHPKDTFKYHQKVNIKNNPTDNLKDNPTDNLKPNLKANLKGEPSDNLNDNAKDNLKHNAKDNLKDTVKNNLKCSSNDNLEGCSKDVCWGTFPELCCLEQQRDNITILDELIKRTKQSLRVLKEKCATKGPFEITKVESSKSNSPKNPSIVSFEILQKKYSIDSKEILGNEDLNIIHENGSDNATLKEKFAKKVLTDTTKVQSSTSNSPKDPSAVPFEILQKKYSVNSKDVSGFEDTAVIHDKGGDNATMKEQLAKQVPTETTKIQSSTTNSPEDPSAVSFDILGDKGGDNAKVQSFTSNSPKDPSIISFDILQKKYSVESKEVLRFEDVEVIHDNGGDNGRFEQISVPSLENVAVVISDGLTESVLSILSYATRQAISRLCGINTPSQEVSKQFPNANVNLVKDEEIIGNNVEKEQNSDRNNKKRKRRTKSQNLLAPYDNLETQFDAISCNSDVKSLSTVKSASTKSGILQSKHGIIQF